MLNENLELKILRKEKDLGGITEGLIKGIKIMEEKMDNIKKNKDNERKK